MKFLPALLASAALLHGCSSAPPVINSALLSHLSEGEKQAIRQARERQDEAQDVYARAQWDTKVARDEIRLAEALATVARAHQKAAELLDEIAAGRTSEEQQRARALLAYRNAAYDAAQKQLAYCERERERLSLEERRCEEVVLLRAATVELAKARAVQHLDQPEVQAIPLEAFEEESRHREGNIEDIAVDLRKASERAQEARLARDAADEQAAKLRPPALRD